MITLNTFKHLLPRARAWSLTADKRLRQFFTGLAPLGDDIRVFFEDIWLDIFPETTRELDAWEEAFGLPFASSLTEQERRDRLTAAWQAQGGQDPQYIQDTLQAAGFNVYVHEWWEVPVVGAPVARNPLDYLNDGSGAIPYLFNVGALVANVGAVEANVGSSSSPTGYALVNKINETSTGSLGVGDPELNTGGSVAQVGTIRTTTLPKSYIVPGDPTKWPYFLYIGGQTFPDHATLSITRKNEFESLCLKLCPTQQWIGVLADFT